MPNPAAVSELDKFLSLLEKSTLVSTEKMAEIRSAAEGHDDAKALARYLIKTGALTKWQALQLLSGWNAFRIDKYHLLSQLGSGEHSRMYLAEHRAMGRKVILRTLPRRSAERPELLRRFLKEAQAASQLDHRNVIHVYDVNSEGDRYFVVMEYVDGRSLLDIVGEDGPLTPTKAADYLRQAAEGLAYAHAQGVIHRELSPAKLIIDSQGQLKILEMGISGLDEPSETASTDISGAPTAAGAYLAPEQCQARPVADERSDIYALGATLYYLLSGKSPLAPAAASKPRDLLQLRSDVPESLVDLCEKMMASATEDRFGSANELKTALETWLEQQRPAAPPVRRKPAASESAPVASAPQSNGDKSPAAKAPPPKAKPKVAKPLEESVKPATSESGSFPAFDVAAAPRKNGKAPAKKARQPVAEATTEDEGEEQATVAKPTKKGPPLALIIGGAIGGLALLVVIGVVTAFMMTGGDDKKQVAKKEDNKKSDAAVAVEDAAKKASPEQPPVEEEKPTEPMPMPEVAPMVEEPKPEEPKPEEPKPEEPKPEEPKPEDPKPEEPKPEPKSEPKSNPKPEPKPEPPPAIEPFAEVAKAVELPSLGLPGKPNASATEVVTLGPIKLEQGGVMFMRLLGGEKATDGKSSLTLTTAGSDQSAWEVNASDAKSGSQIVAKLALAEGNLTFQWTPEATQSPQLCAGLINCALDLSSGPKSHRLALRLPIEASPLTMNLERAVSKFDFDIPHAPDAALVKVEILKVEGGPKATTDKSQLSAAKDSAFVTFGDKPEEQMLLMKVDSLMKQKLSISLSPHVKTEGGPQKFTLKQFNTQRMAITGQQQQIFAGIEAMRKAKRPKEQIEQAEKQMEALTEMMNKFTAAEGQLQSISAAQVQFRVYYEPAPGEQIDLVTTAGGGPAAKLPAGDDIPKLNLGKGDDE